MAEEKKPSDKKKALTQLEQDVYDLFGMLPNEDRLSIFPRYKKGEGFIAPEFVYDIAKGFRAPRTAMYSELGPEEALNMALNVTGGSSVASAPRGALRMGMGRGKSATDAPDFMNLIKKLTTDIAKAEKAGDTKSALAKRNELNEAIRLGVNDPLMPRAKPLTKVELQMYADRMAPQVAGELTRGSKGAQTVAGKTQQQFKREQTLPVDRKVLPGATDPSAPLPYMTLEDQKGSVLLGLPGDPTLARVSLSGIGDVPFERPVTLHGGPRYGDEEKLWASNLGAATGLLSAADRASRQYGNAPVIASYTKMPSGLGFAQHYLESLLQYQRPDQLTKKAQQALTKDIKEGFINAQGKRVTFPDFPGFGNMDAVLDRALTDTNLRKHLADRLEKGKKYGLRPAGDVQFAVSHPELTNLETGASGFTLGELTPGQLTKSAHPTYSHDIPGKVLGQTQYPMPYDMLYRDQLEMIRKNPKAPEFNTLKLMGARQKIDDQLINELNDYQEQMRKLLGRKKGGAVNMDEGGLVFYGARQSGDGIKGKGYFGPLAGREGTVTELSAEDESGEFPLVVPTLTAEELELLLAGKDPTSEIMGKARSWADTRRKRGKSPFAEPMELRMPKPKAEGGSVYSPRPGLVFVGQEHGQIPELPPDVKEMANKVGAFYEGAGGDKLPDIRYRGSWDDAASRSVKGYPPEYLYTIFTNTDVNKQKDALISDGTIFNSLLKNQQQVGYFKDRRFNRKDLTKFLQSMGPEFLGASQSPATESNVEDFLKRGEQLMWESGDTSAKQMANKANESRQRWLLSQPKGVFFVGSDHVQKLKELHGAGKKESVKKAEGGSVSLTDLPDDVTPSNWREHLQKNVLADARALLGVKDGGVINLDELIEKSLKKKDGGVINLDELIEWTMAKDKHRKMKEGGGVFNTDPDITDSGRIIPHNI